MFVYTCTSHFCIPIGVCIYIYYHYYLSASCTKSTLGPTAPCSTVQFIKNTYSSCLLITEQHKLRPAQIKAGILVIFLGHLSNSEAIVRPKCHRDTKGLLDAWLPAVAASHSSKVTCLFLYLSSNQSERCPSSSMLLRLLLLVLAY